MFLLCGLIAKCNEDVRITANQIQLALNETTPTKFWNYPETLLYHYSFFGMFLHSTAALKFLQYFDLSITDFTDRFWCL